jgi:hypothetical protein
MFLLSLIASLRLLDLLILDPIIFFFCIMKNLEVAPVHEYNQTLNRQKTVLDEVSSCATERGQ